IFYWLGLYSLLREQNKVKELEGMVLSKLPETTRDWQALLKLLERVGTSEQVTAAIDATTIWLANNPQDASVRTAYLGLVERKGTSEQVTAVIDATTTWLANNLQDTHVYATYLGLVERKGTSEQVTTAID